MKKLYILLIFFIFTQNPLQADLPRFIDFKYILNNSETGKKAQKFLKTKLENGLKNFKKEENKILEDEKKIIQQKKILSSEEYLKKVNELRKKVSSLQKERNGLLENIAKQRSKARNELLKNLNPILKEYMQENNIRMVIDKKSLLLADENLDLTNEIIKRLNNKLKSIELK